MRIPVIIMLLLGTLSLQGKDYPTLHFTVENGLPSNTVYDVCTDSKGFIWLGTDKGLARFNGLKFETFTTEDGLPDNEIFSVQEDLYGRLWLGTYNGIIGYYKDNKFHTGRNDPLLAMPFKPSIITHINLEKDSSVTMYFLDKTHIVNFRNDHKRLYSLKKLNAIYPSKNIQFIRKVSESVYRIVYQDKVLLVDTNMRILNEYKTPLTQCTQKREVPYFVVNDTVYTEDGKKSDIVHNLWDTTWTLTAVHTDSKNCIVGTNRGAIINNAHLFLERSFITSVNIDKEGNYWLTTLGEGVHVLSKYFNVDEYYKGVYSNVARYAVADSSSVYFCTQNKNLYRIAQGKTELVFDASLYISSGSLFHRNAYLVENNTYYAFGNSENFIVINIDKKPVLKKQFSIQSEVYSSGIYYIEPYLYFFRSLGFYFIPHADLFSNKTIRATFVVNPVKDEFLYAKAMSDDKQLWYSAIDKVYQVKNGRPVVKFRNLSFRAFEILGNYIVGYTPANKLLVINDLGNSYLIDSVKGENCIWDKIYKLDNKHILISTNNLYRVITVHPSDKKADFDITTLEDPFIPLFAEFICANGKDCYFFKNGSVTGMRLDHILQKALPPPITFTAVNTKDKSWPLGASLNFSYKDAAYINISFAAPALGKKVLYEYSITPDGDADKWTPVNNEDLSLYNLSYGNYTVKARARTIAGASGIPAIIKLSIARPFWAQWWFVVLVVTATGFILWQIIQYRTRRLIHQRELKHQGEMKFLKSEYKALNAMMNPHFIFNSLNSVQWLITSNDKAGANEYLRIFSDMVRQNMHNVSKELITLKQEIDLVSNYLRLEKLRFKEFLNYEMQVDDIVELDDIMVPPLLIQPLVENAVKHGLFPRRSIENNVIIKVFEAGAELHINVLDNGVGLNHSKMVDANHDSYGIDNIKKRIAQLSLIHEMDISFAIHELVDVHGRVQGTEAVVVIISKVEV